MHFELDTMISVPGCRNLLLDDESVHGQFADFEFVDPAVSNCKAPDGERSYGQRADRGGSEGHPHYGKPGKSR